MKFIDYARECPYFATFDDKKVDAGSVGCGHLNQGLAAMNQEIAVPPEFEQDKDLISNTGEKRLVKHDICERDRSVTQSDDLKSAVDGGGMQWTYIYSNVES